MQGEMALVFIAHNVIRNKVSIAMHGVILLRIGMKENQKISLVFIAIFMAHLMNGSLTLNGHSAI
mgnify:CR=1 FL=1